MISVAGTQPALLYVWNLDLETGRMFTDEEVFHRAKVVVIGHSPRRDLFPSVDPVGKTLRIGDDDFTVVGAFVERKTLFGEMGENFALMPYTTYLATLWREFDNRTVFGAVRPGVSVEAAKDDVIRVMRHRRRLKASQENDFAVTSSDAALEFLQRITGPVAAVLAAISSIALIVGGIGVMNMMLVSVTERTGEIGIRKAVGATRRDILLQFLVEAGSLTGIGGILGITLGFGAALVISRLTGLPVSLSPYYVAVAVVFSVLIGVFFGIYPANRASKLDPVAAMNYAKN
jgi:putative ABC transport system permease protein